MVNNCNDMLYPMVGFFTNLFSSDDYNIRYLLSIDLFSLLASIMYYNIQKAPLNMDD